QQMEREKTFPAAREAYQNFSARSPPEKFAGAASYRLGLLYAWEANGPAAAGMFQSLLEKYPNARGESGLPLGPLAQLKLVELAAWATNHPSGQMLESLCSNAVFNPSPVT